MNRIIEVNEANAFALVEPGVSYFDVHRHIQEHKLKVWIDCPDPGWGSVIGNALDRGGGYTTANYRNHFDSHCGVEIVLPNGELLRTGMGAIPNAKTWQQYKSGCGPWIDGIFSQSNFGIVTKMGFWLMPQPEAYLRGTVSLSRYEDLAPMVETLNYLENARITAGFPDIASPLNGYPPSGQLQLWNETGPPRMTDEHRKLLSSAKLGYSPCADSRLTSFKQPGTPRSSMALPSDADSPLVQPPEAVIANQRINGFAWILGVCFCRFQLPRDHTLSHGRVIKSDRSRQLVGLTVTLDERLI